MNDKELDNIIKNKINDNDQLPDDITWTVDRGWQQYEHLYRRTVLGYKWIKYAAVFALLITTVGIAMYVTNSTEYTEVSTGVGEKTQIKLSDGSRIWLNSNTSVKYPIRLSRRNAKIQVDGEAYFELAGKYKKPVMIEAGNTISYVAQSSFNIRAVKGEDNVEIALTKGEMQLDYKAPDSSEKMHFSSGNIASIHRSNELIFVEPNTDKNTLAWKTGRLEFNEVPLYFIVRKLNKVYGYCVDVERDTLLYTPVTLNGSYDNIMQVLEDISAQTKLSIKETENGYIILSEKVPSQGVNL